MNTCKTCHVFSHLSDTDESSELDSSEELQWQKAKASAIQRLENANEWDMESEISQPIRDALMTPEAFGEPQTIARRDEDPSDSVETETVAAKKNDSNSRIRWLETKLQDVDTNKVLCWKKRSEILALRVCDYIKQLQQKLHFFSLI